MTTSYATHDATARTGRHEDSVAVADQPTVRGGLEEFERSGQDKPPFFLTMLEVKLLGIAGVGFFLDGASFVSAHVSCEF